MQEFILSANDGLKLSGTKWTAQKPKAALCLVHGLGDQHFRHLPFIEYIVSNGITVYAYDQRGHGRSEGKRGHTPSYQAFLDDLKTVIQAIKQEQADLPLVLYGHSFGGNIVANYILKYGHDELDAGIISSAWLKLHIEPPAFRLALGKLMNKIYPAYRDKNDIDASNLSADKTVVEAYGTDPLVHPYITTTTYFETAAAAQWALAHAEILKIPTLIMHGDKDQTTSPLGSQEFAHKAGHLAELKIWEGYLHETHNEIGKEKVFDFVYHWICRTVDTIDAAKKTSGEQA